METETKSYNFTEKRAAQLEKARQKRWELHKQNTEPQGEEKPPEVEPPVVETPPPEPPEKEKEEVTLASLELQLKQAIEDEDYSLAVKLQNEISKFN